MRASRRRSRDRARRRRASRSKASASWSLSTRGCSAGGSEAPTDARAADHRRRSPSPPRGASARRAPTPPCYAPAGRVMLRLGHVAPRADSLAAPRRARRRPDRGLLALLAHRPRLRTLRARPLFRGLGLLTPGHPLPLTRPFLRLRVDRQRREDLGGDQLRRLGEMEHPPGRTCGGRRASCHFHRTSGVQRTAKRRLFGRSSRRPLPLRGSRGPRRAPPGRAPSAVTRRA